MRTTPTGIARWLAPIAALSMIALSAAPALASPPEERLGSGARDIGLLALIADNDVFAEADLVALLPLSPMGGKTQHYGPYASGSPDSGTCGNDWADDTYDRHFTVRQTGPGTYEVIQQFKRGSFVTRAGLSPGACEPSGTTMVAGGLAGTMHGFFVITVTGTQTSTDAACSPGSPPADCTTTGFITSHFAGGFTIGTFFFHYAGNDGSNKSLVAHEWQNASADRGGNKGDIATS